MSEKTFMATLSWYALDPTVWNPLANVDLVWWYNHVPRYLGPYAEGNHRTCTIIYEGQDHRTSGAEILCLDRWFYLSFIVDLPTNVDLQARVR